MTAIHDFLFHPLMTQVGWALFHFLWQGLLIAGMLAFTLRALSNRSANQRYVASCVALLLMVASLVATFAWLSWKAKPFWAPSGAGWSKVHHSIGMEPAHQETGPPFGTFSVSEPARLSAMDWLSARLPWLAAGWLLAVLALSLRLLFGYCKVRRIRIRSQQLLGEPWESRVRELAQRLGVTRPVQLCHSCLVEVPTVIGWLRPVILFPASLLSGLSTAQIDAILTHELAHIRRHDYLVNFLQSVAEILFFFHPAVWWVSRQISQEREICCDQWAVEVSGDPIGYARALAALEEMRGSTAPALAARGGSLTRRIRRLLGRDEEANRTHWWLAGTFGLLVTAALALNTQFSLASAEPGVLEATDRKNLSTPGEAAPERADGLSMKAKVVQALPRTTPQIRIAVKFAELSDHDFQALGLDWFLAGPPEDAKAIAQVSVQTGTGATNSAGGALTNSQAKLVGRLTEPQFRSLLETLEKRPGVTVLSLPAVTTLSGRRAKVAATEKKTIHMGSRMAESEPDLIKTVPEFEDVELGPSVELLPEAHPESGSIQLEVKAGLVEFLGYDDPGPFRPVSEGNALKGAVPLPRFRHLVAETKTQINDGQTIVISGIEVRDLVRFKSRVPVLGDVPLLGRLFRNESTAESKRNIIIFVTPHLVDPAGLEKPPAN